MINIIARVILSRLDIENFHDIWILDYPCTGSIECIIETVLMFYWVNVQYQFWVLVLIKSVNNWRATEALKIQILFRGNLSRGYWIIIIVKTYRLPSEHVNTYNYSFMNFISIIYNIFKFSFSNLFHSYKIWFINFFIILSWIKFNHLCWSSLNKLSGWITPNKNYTSPNIIFFHSISILEPDIVGQRHLRILRSLVVVLAYFSGWLASLLIFFQ